MLGHLAEGEGHDYVSLKATNNDIMANIVNPAFKVKYDQITGLSTSESASE